jgi:RNA polymerase sigma factor (sigma-70 family)
VQRELVEQAQRGDHEAFATLAGSAFARLEGAARLILRDPDVAKDAVQEALLRAWRDLRSLRDPRRFDAWLYRLLVRACYDELRRSRRATHESEIPELHHPFAPDEISISVERDALNRGFRRLEPRQRALIVLHLYVGLPLPTVADALDIPLGTAKSRLHRSLGELRAALDADARVGELVEGGVA